MTEDKKGFYYPIIDSVKCIDCGLCNQICQFNKKEISEAKTDVICYALRHKKMSVVKASRSAGAFTAISDYILNIGGVIYGAAFDADFTVVHKRAETDEQRNRFRESKYVQSTITGVFENVADDLSANKNVLFTGTGCQCDGLRSFLKAKKINKKNLLIADIVCHGVPSPKMFEEYLRWNEQKENSKITEFKFRDKEKYSWSEGIEKIRFANGKIRYQDFFTGYFFSNYVRSCCHKCKYTTPYRNSDITLADFWGSEKSCPEFTDYKNGSSLVLIHSEKGVSVFDHIKDSIEYKKVDINNCLQPRLQTPREKLPDTDFYWKEYCDKGFDYIMNRYASNSLSIKNRLISLVKRICS